MTTEVKLPPNSREAERAILGAMLRDSWLVPEVVRVVTADEFYSLAHKAIFEAIICLSDGGKSPDLVAIGEYLLGKNQLDECGGNAYLSELYAGLSAGNITDHAEIVRNYATKRDVIRACAELTADAWDAGIQGPELLESADRRIGVIADRGIVGEVVTMQRAISEAYERLDRRKGMATPDGIMSGLIDLDKLTCGFQSSELTILAARPSVGKAQPLDADVLTPRGFVAMGSLEVGDFVIGSDGRPTKVLAIYPQGELPVFRVETTDGGSTECCDEHLWFTQTRKERKRNSAGSVKSLAEIRETITRDVTKSPNHALPIVGAVEFMEQSEPLRLHPYAMGLLLGDGEFTGSCVRFSNPELDIQQQLARLLPSEDCLVIGKDRLNHRIRRENLVRTKENQGGEISSTRQVVMSYRLSGRDSYSKFIPNEYLYASVDERIELLRGLVDSDGYVCHSGKSFEISTSSPELAKGILFLVRSLGGFASTKIKQPFYSYKGERLQGADSYRMTIQFNNGIVPVSSVKHVAKLSTGGRLSHRSIKSIEPVGVKPCQCIMVEADDHLYVTDDFIVTHNTACALQFAAHAAIETGEPVLFVSLEQARIELAERFICAYSRVDSHRLRTGYLSADEMNLIINAGEKFGGAPIYIDDKPGQTMMQISASARRIKQRHGLRMVVIDYLQLIESDSSERRANRQEQVSAISRRLKLLARELKVPVVALAQLNRGVEDRAGGKPRLSDLRESGSIEQDADVVMLLHRQDDGGPVTAQIDLIVAKNRSGPTGDVSLLYVKPQMRFENMAMEHGAQA